MEQLTESPTGDRTCSGATVHERHDGTGEAFRGLGPQILRLLPTTHVRSRAAAPDACSRHSDDCVALLLKYACPMPPAHTGASSSSTHSGKS